MTTAVTQDGNFGRCFNGRSFNGEKENKTLFCGCSVREKTSCNIVLA